MIVFQVDLVSQYGRPELGLEYYTQAEDLGQLAQLMSGTGSAFPPRFRRLTAALCEVGGWRCHFLQQASHCPAIEPLVA